MNNVSRMFLACRWADKIVEVYKGLFIIGVKDHFLIRDTEGSSPVTPGCAFTSVEEAKAEIDDHKLLPIGYWCPCGKQNHFDAYVFAHTHVDLVFTCECGIKVTLNFPSVREDSGDRRHFPTLFRKPGSEKRWTSKNSNDSVKKRPATKLTSSTSTTTTGRS